MMRHYKTPREKHTEHSLTYVFWGWKALGFLLANAKLKFIKIMHSVTNDLF